MKKILSLLVVIMVMMLGTVSAFAHPAVPEQSIGKVNPKAVTGMHTAWANIQDSNGIAKHVFEMRHSPH